MNYLIVVLVVAAVVVAYFVGRAKVPKPAPPAPPPVLKVFGYTQAEQLSARVGGLTPETANVVEIAALVGGLEFRVREEAVQKAEYHAGEAQAYAANAEALRAQALVADSSASANAKRADRIRGLAANFGVKK